MVSGLKMPLISFLGDTFWGVKGLWAPFQGVTTAGAHSQRKDGRIDRFIALNVGVRIVNHKMLIFCGVHQVYGESFKYSMGGSSS